VFDYFLVGSLIVLSILVLVAVSDVFVNAIENLGKELDISESAAGSVFAAIGTALPETIIPFVAIFGMLPEVLNSGDMNILMSSNEYNIAIGAILGAPLMLSTLAFALMGAASLMRDKNKGVVMFKDHTVKRDLTVFLIGITVFMGAIVIENRVVQMSCGLILVLTYITYLVIALSESREEEEVDDDIDELKLNSIVLIQNHMAAILIQLFIALVFVIGAAKALLFGINSLTELISHSSFVDKSTITTIAFLVALFIITIATELPEKINSFIWIRRGKDHMALGNVTGAMTFQTTMIPGLFMLIVPFQCNLLSHHGGSVIITAIMAIILLLLSKKDFVRWYVLAMFTIPYIAFALTVGISG